MRIWCENSRGIFSSRLFEQAVGGWYGAGDGSQRSLDLINKRNGKHHPCRIITRALRIANAHGVAVDALLLFSWEDDEDLRQTTGLVEFIASNDVRGKDEQGRQMRNHVDSTIMTPYQGTKFYDLFHAGKFPAVEVKADLDPGNLY
ncbi:MAG: hypothetical protein CM1200mP41_29270 [Gammaproteobacteria bacterium]|nr:MAG: hypothetical protein CM1200mP41_29270 [Gammaproteobacteria bacterium]